MSHQSRNLDYADIAKKGFLFGVGLFALGAAGVGAGHAFVALPSIVEQVFLGMEVTGVLVGLLVPIVFGAVLPLVE